jgi:phosphatidylinositol-3-phosphatase
MSAMRYSTVVVTALVAFLALSACTTAANPGVPGSSTDTAPKIEGTVFTIVFENQDAQAVLVPANSNFYRLSQTYGRADAYISNQHPSLANYIVMTSGDRHGIASNNPPATNTPVPGTDNLADQLDAAGIRWRAYMESMGTPCNQTSSNEYGVQHNPWVYYTSLTADPQRCNDHVVDFDENFAADLAADNYDYMWISPNMCNDMHDCPADVADAWLGRTVDQIMASPGYQRGGAIFVMFDEGHVRIFNSSADLATIVISPNLVSQPYATSTRFDHRSYLATIEDIFNLGRLPTTTDATPMDEFFVSWGSSTRRGDPQSTAVPATGNGGALLP